MGEQREYLKKKFGLKQEAKNAGGSRIQLFLDRREWGRGGQDACGNCLLLAYHVR